MLLMTAVAVQAVAAGSSSRQTSISTSNGVFRCCRIPRRRGIKRDERAVGRVNVRLAIAQMAVDVQISEAAMTPPTRTG